MKFSAKLRLIRRISRSPREVARSPAFASVLAPVLGSSLVNTLAFAAVLASVLAFASCEQESLPPAEPYSETAEVELANVAGTETIAAELVFTNLSDDFDSNPNRGTLVAIADGAADSSHQHARTSVIVETTASAKYRWEMSFEPAIVSWIHADFDASAEGSGSSRAAWTLSCTADGIIWTELASADVAGTAGLAVDGDPDSAYRLFTAAAFAEYAEADDWLDGEGNASIPATPISGIRLDLEASCEAAEATEENPVPLAGSISLICKELRPVFP